MLAKVVETERAVGGFEVGDEALGSERCDDTGHPDN